MQVHLFDFRWINPHQFEFQASVGQKFARKKLQIGDKLSIEVKSEVSCCGSMKDDIWKPCPHHILGRKKCEMCRNRESNFVFTAFDGFNTDNYTPEDLAQIQGPHVVYLALFDKKTIKVGVSKLDRKELRQIEQGSHFTLYIAQTSDGIKARQIETLIRKTGLADKILLKAKKELIFPEITEEEGREILINELNTRQNCLDKYPTLKTCLLTNPEFVNWENIYHFPNFYKNNKSLHDLKLDNEEYLSGTILCAKGPFLIIETPDEIFSIATKDLIGCQIEFEERPAGIKLNQSIQHTLF
jgi:hypothetical protein